MLLDKALTGACFALAGDCWTPFVLPTVWLEGFAVALFVSAILAISWSLAAWPALSPWKPLIHRAGFGLLAVDVLWAIVLDLTFGTLWANFVGVVKIAITLLGWHR